MEAVLFYLFGATALVSAFFVVVLRKPVHNALFLILTFFCLGALFLLLRAEFIALVQVLVYAGAIMVLFLFVIMLLNLERAEEKLKGHNLQKWVGVVAGIAILVMLQPVWLSGMIRGAKGPFLPEKVEEVGNIVVVAKLLFTDYLVPFEIASILLLIAIIGAVLLAKRSL